MKFPFYKQLDAMDCGPSCLRMICSYYGKNYSLNMFRELCHQSRDGVSLQNISRAAEKVGFKTVGGKFTIDIFINKIPLPCIIFWDQKHFVVVYKIKKSGASYNVFVADPGKGKIKYTLKEFLNHWTGTDSHSEAKGIGLLLEPTNEFKNIDNEASIEPNKIKFLGKYFLKYKKYFGQLILGLILGSIIQLILPFLTQSIVDTGISSQNTNFIVLVLIAQFALLLSNSLIDFLRRRVLLHISTRINISLISDFFIKLMKLPMSFFDTKQIGDLIERVDDHDRVQRFLTTQSLGLLFSVFNIVIFGIVLSIYNVKIFLIFIIGSLLYCGWVILFLNKRRLYDYRRFEQQAINKGKVYQLLNGMQEIKQQGCEQRKRWEWEETQADLFNIDTKLLSLQQTQRVGSFFISEFRNILITFISATAVISGDMTLGMMLAVQYIIGQLNSPVDQVMNFIYDFQDVSISFERMHEIHERSNEESRSSKITELPENRSIKINNLSFQYEGPTSPFVLSNINLEVPERKVTAIVGASGSGKTTLIKLLLGYYETVQGEIYIGHRPLSYFNKSWWRSQCGAVLQDGFIFSDTIAQNIAVSDEEINMENLLQSASVANIKNFIYKLPLSFNTMIGRDGQNLSQGQKQRILIARAVYKNSPFLYFDEATNALDANNERIILNNLEQFYKGKTVIVVAHRLSTVMNADKIIVLNNGKITEEGTYKELIDLKKEFYTLVKNQLELGN
ncbi:MAG: peptidase domain-containing ABC transporter [Tannerellaceae bacterium]|jgi:ATP-binding cassette subfamily B protein|nr:peptidase domain-containing ABC transporter [Tannerellaceae bacterium]